MQRRTGLAPIALAAVALAACGGSAPPANEGRSAPPGPSYSLSIITPSGAAATLTGISATWDPETGVVILGPEETGEPLAMLIFQIVQDDVPVIVTATLSTTDRRAGTADQLNGMLFGAPVGPCGSGASQFEGLGVTSEWVAGRICLSLAGLEPEDVPARAYVRAEFFAFRN